MNKQNNTDSPFTGLLVGVCVLAWLAFQVALPILIIILLFNACFGN